jgi:hypothetical protein
MTLHHVRPATINSTKLLAFVLFAVGIAVFAYLLADRGALQQPPIVSTGAWSGGFVLLALDGRKRRTEQTPDRSDKPTPSLRHKPRRSSNHIRHTPPAAEYTHQISHF